jgi:hypothetical protein
MPQFKNCDMRKSFPCKDMTTCRYFRGYAVMRASFAPRQTTKQAQYASTPALDNRLGREGTTTEATVTSQPIAAGSAPWRLRPPGRCFRQLNDIA